MNSADEKLTLREFVEESGIDLQQGISLCMNDVAFYMEILREFYRENKIDKLELLFDNQDWENYRIEVHALKNNLKTIGALDESSMAYGLEMACRNEDATYCVNNHTSFLEAYGNLLSIVGKVI